MKNVFSIIILLFIISSANSQIAGTKSQILNDYKNSKIGIDNGKEYITYTVASKTYNTVVLCYFTDKEVNKEQICNKVWIIEPSSEINTWIKFFDEDFVKINEFTYKDYEHSVIYTFFVENGNCYICQDYDEKL